MDALNYNELFGHFELPPILSFAGEGDAYLGHPHDCAAFLKEIGADIPKSFIHLSQKNGNKHDYDHVSMLPHKDAVDDHFPKLVQWMGSIAR